MTTKRTDAPTRLLTWAVRAAKGDNMADKTQQQKKPDGITKNTIALYAKLIGDEQNIQLNKPEKELFAALLTKKYPQLSMIAALADTPAKLPLKARTKAFGNWLFYLACGILGVFVLYSFLKG